MTYEEAMSNLAGSMDKLTEQVREYVDDHFNCFGGYPMDVEVDGRVYDWDEYWTIYKSEG